MLRSGEHVGVMRVGIDAMPTLPPAGGVGRYAAGLLRALQDARSTDLELVPFVPRHRRSASAWVLLELQSATRCGFDVFHFPFYFPPLRPRCPVTVAVHDVLLFERPEWFPRAWGTWMRLLIARGMREAAAVITGSWSAAEAIVGLGLAQRDRIRVIRYGVDDGIFAPPSAARVAETRERHGLSRPFVVQFGALEPRRGVDLSLAAVREVRGHVTDLELVLVGSARAAMPGLEVPPAWVHRLGEVTDADMPALLAGALAVLAPSRGEGFDLPVLEALACGAAVVASDIPVHMELFGDATAGFASGDAADMARALLEVVTQANRSNCLRAAGPELAARFTWAATARDHVRLWREVGG